MIIYKIVGELEVLTGLHIGAGDRWWGLALLIIQLLRMY